MNSNGIGSCRFLVALFICLSLTFQATAGFAGFKVKVAEAPASDLALTLQAIRSANHSLLLNAYQMSSTEIENALMDRIRAGIHVEIIKEGQPVGGESQEERVIQSQLIQAMKSASGQDHFYEMTAKKVSQRRFHFDHAKYAVIDNETLLIGSENYSPTGNPGSGDRGNRGWEVLVFEPHIAVQFSDVFKNDSDASYGDIIDWVADDLGLNKKERPEIFTRYLEENLFAGTGVNGNYGITRTVLPHESISSPVLLEATEVSKITAPDESLSGLENLIANAKSSLDLELMTFDSHWGGPSQESPLFDAVLKAARRGVKVRILLNDESVFSHGKRSSRSKNRPTVERLSQLASQERLDIQAAIADTKAMNVTYIHNKGMLIDDDQTLISSINWNENAVEKNREAAVVLRSSQINSHYKSLFESDWNSSARGARVP